MNKGKKKFMGNGDGEAQKWSIESTIVNE